jgi:hypothetical protein
MGQRPFCLGATDTALLSFPPTHPPGRCLHFQVRHPSRPHHQIKDSGNGIQAMTNDHHGAASTTTAKSLVRAPAKAHNAATAGAVAGVVAGAAAGTMRAFDRSSALTTDLGIIKPTSTKEGEGLQEGVAAGVT